jgi:hypothetical protein
MERRVSVNANKGFGPPSLKAGGLDDGSQEGRLSELWNEAMEDEDSQVDAASAPAAPQSNGPCLYLGPSGQRCARPATEGMFCRVHGGAGHLLSIRGIARILAVAAVIGMLLWPYLSHLVGEIVGWASAP